MIVACARCEREVRQDDDCCPFCGFDPLCDPARFGPFDLLEVRGRGAMSVVFKAMNRHETIALKVLESTDPKFLDQFDREGEVVKELSHPNIVRVFERGDVDDHGYLAMEYIDGPPLALAIKKKAFSQSGYAEIVAKVARGLQQAHKGNIVHRDITPGNILLTSAGVPKIVDFGLAIRMGGKSKLAAGETAGTPVYMSPEQAAGLHEMTNARTDIYSLGAVLFEAVTGRPPFFGTGVHEILKKVQNEEPVMSPDVHPELAAIIRRAMSKNPASRYATMNDFADALQQWVAGRK